MIRSFKHRGLKRFYERDDCSGIRSDFADTIQEILTVLDDAAAPQELDLPGYRLHPLKGNLNEGKHPANEESRPPWANRKERVSRTPGPLRHGRGGDPWCHAPDAQQCHPRQVGNQPPNGYPPLEGIWQHAGNVVTDAAC